MDAEARCEHLLLELNSVRHQMQALRSRELELEDLLRSVRAQCARSLDEERITAAAKFRKSCANREFVEETICKLRGDLKSALQARDAMREEREALLDAYEGLQSKFDVLEQAKVATEEEESIKRQRQRPRQKLRQHAPPSPDSSAHLRQLLADSASAPQCPAPAATSGGGGEGSSDGGGGIGGGSRPAGPLTLVGAYLQALDLLALLAQTYLMYQCKS